MDPISDQPRFGRRAPVSAPIVSGKPEKRGGLWRRINRKQYWLIAMISVAVEFGLVLVHAYSKGMIGLTIWAMSGRLRDLGRSGWWTLVIIALSIASMLATWSFGPNAAVAVGGLVELACFVALGVMPGQPGSNRFGPAPGQPTVAETAEVFS